MTDVLRVENLSINAGPDRSIVSNVNLSVRKGQVVGLIGESGSGKTTIGLAALGFLQRGLQVASGRVLLGADDVFQLDRNDLRYYRGNRVAYVAQSAAAAFNPSLSINNQVFEPLLEHKLADSATVKARVLDLYHQLELPDAERIGLRFPHQVSGGQLQRLMTAMAFSTRPDLIVFDEPTTALDVTTQVKVLRAFKRAIQDHQTAAIYISHDLPVVAQIADYIIVLRDGFIVEQGNVREVIEDAKEEYTKQLLAAARVFERSHRPSSYHPESIGLTEEPLLSGKGLVVEFKDRDRAGSRVIAVTDLSFSLNRGEILGVVGESGSGKSTLARAIAGIVPRTSGELRFDKTSLPANRSDRTNEMLRRIQIVFQSADTALNPKHTVGQILGRVARQLCGLSAEDARLAVKSTLAAMQLPAYIERRFPHELSGGQKQRVNLARALIAKPDVIICDEVTSALDPLIRQEIIKMLLGLREEYLLSIIFISHDISTVSELADSIIVMSNGRSIEQGDASVTLTRPQQPYTRALIASVPQLRPGWLENFDLPKQKLERVASS